MERDKRRDPEKYAHIWLGQYHATAKPASSATGGLKSSTPRGCPVLLRRRLGLQRRPDDAGPVFVEGRTLYVDREVYKVGCEIDRTPALFDTLDEGQAASGRSAPTTPGQRRSRTCNGMLSEDRPGDQGQGSVEDGIEFPEVLRHRGSSALSAHRR